MSARALLVAGQTSARPAGAPRGGMPFAIGLYVLVVAVLSGLWRAAAGANGGEVAGYSAVALTWYIATTEAVTISIGARLIEEIGTDIGSGAVAVELLRPASVLWVRVVAVVGGVIPRVAMLAVVGGVVATVMAGAPPRPAALVLAVPSLVLAVACNVVAQHAFAGAAFWLRDAGTAWFLYQKLVFVLGGMLIPLQALPAWLHDLARALPFNAMAYAPARLASGHVEPMLLLEQVAWLVLLGAVAAAVFRAGERRLQVVGG
jgi:ABC-2 type transport system permease protein